MTENKSSDTLANIWSALGASRFQQIALTLIVLVSFSKGIAWSLLIPPLYGFDEPLHFMYGRNIANTHNLRIKPSTLIPLDIWELDEPEAKRTPAKNGVSPRDLYHDDVDQVVVTQPYFYTYHPPLYYCLVAGVETCLRQAGTVWEVIGCRFISIVLGVCTAVLAYFAGRIFWKEEKSLAPIAMATIVIYQPMSAFSFATITNSSLEITLFSALLVIGLRIIHTGFTKKLSAILSIIVLAGMLNKLSFIAALPLVILLVVWSRVNQSSFKVSGLDLLSRLFMLLLPSAIASYWWYQKGWQTGGDSLVHSFEMQMHPKPFSLFRYFSTKPWFEAYGKTVASYFGHFGWKDAALSLPIITSLTFGMSLCALISCARALMALRARESFEARCRGYSILFSTCASLCLVLFYAAVDMRVNAVLGGGWFTIRGQYYLSAIVGQALWVVSAVQWNASTLRSNFALAALCCGAVLLNFYALIGVVAAHCFGVCDLSELFVRAANLQPLSATAIGGIFLVYVIMSFALLGFVIVATVLAGRKSPLKSMPGDFA